MESFEPKKLALIRIWQIFNKYSDYDHPLAQKREELLRRMSDLQASVDFIDWKQGFYDDVLSGKTEYYSNLIRE